MAIPVILALIALLWIPGAALASGLGAGRWPAVALAPAMTTTLVSVGGIVTDLVGVRWTAGASLFWLFGMPAIVGVARLAVIWRGRTPWRFDAPRVHVWQVVVGLAASVFIASWIFYQATWAPGYIPQQSDQIFHIGTVRSMLDSGSISSLTADGLNHRESPVFYPAAFHGLVATAVLFLGVPIVVVENALLLVTVALIFPLGMMLMVNTLVARDRHLVLFSGVFALVFTAFPWRVMVWGAVWGQVFGSAFIPAVIAVYGWGLAQVFRGRNWGSAALLLVAALPGLVLGHTSALFAAAVGVVALSLSLALGHALRAPRNMSRWLPFAGFAGLAVVVQTLWAMMTPDGMTRDQERQLATVETAIGIVTLWSEKADAAQFAGFGLAGLAFVGVLYCFRNREDWWLAAVAVLFLVVVTVLESRGPGAVGHWTWPWYDFGFRVQAVMTIYALPLVILGAGALVQSAGKLPRTASVPVLMVFCAALLALVVVQGRTAIKLVAGLYQLDNSRSWISTDEAQGLLQLSEVLPDDAVVATSPWRGGQYLYVLGPEVTALPTEKSSGIDNKTVSTGLKNVMIDPAVCAAVKRMDITYVITGGNGVPLGIKDWYLDHSAVDDVSQAGGFQVVAQGGPYTLWSVPDCDA